MGRKKQNADIGKVSENPILAELKSEYIGMTFYHPSKRIGIEICGDQIGEFVKEYAGQSGYSHFFNFKNENHGTC